jgi:site-specific DNA recombinase
MNPNSKKAAATLPLVLCAVCTRKSTEEGLEQEFNSLDAQRESAEAFIRSQTHEGWTCLPQRYDDGGFTGGNMERPALRRLRLHHATI